MRSHRVLIVEDEPRMRELLLRAVPEMGFDATAARSGEEALRLIESQPADIVLLDLNLPGIGGLDFLARARASHPSIQAIVLTGYGDLTAAQQAMRLDAVDFLTKPTPLGELEKSLERARRRVEALLNPMRPGAVAPGPVEASEIADSADGWETSGARPPSRAGRTLEDLERQHILAALERHAGNRGETAAELGISLRTLYYRLAEYQKQGHLEGGDKGDDATKT